MTRKPEVVKLAIDVSAKNSEVLMDRGGSSVDGALTDHTVRKLLKRWWAL